MGVGSPLDPRSWSGGSFEFITSLDVREDEVGQGWCALIGIHAVVLRVQVFYVIIVLPREFMLSVCACDISGIEVQ